MDRIRHRADLTPLPLAYQSLRSGNDHHAIQRSDDNILARQGRSREARCSPNLDLRPDLTCVYIKRVERTSWIEAIDGIAGDSRRTRSTCMPADGKPFIGNLDLIQPSVARNEHS